MASCRGHLKGKCTTKLIKVCIGNNQRIDSWKWQALKLWTRIRKHWYLCLDVGLQKQTEKVCGNHLRQWMKCLFSITFVFKWNICVVVLSSLCWKLRFSPIIQVSEGETAPVIPSLCKIFNKSLQLGSLPSDWKLANVAPVHKKGAKDHVENYRPIS